MHVRKLDAFRVFLILSGASSLFFSLVFTVNLIYQVSTLALNPLQLVLVGTTLEATVFIFEIPTGVVADVYSRRLSILIGVVLIGLGFLAEGLILRFEGVLVGQVLWGIGITFMSGAQEAWISDEVGEARAGAAFLRSAQVGALSGLIGIGLSVLIGSLQINYPIILGGALFIGLAAFLALFMPENGFKPTPREERSSWQQMAHTLRSGVHMIRVKPVLLTIVAVGLFVGLYSEGYDRLWTDHFLTNFTFPLVGALSAVTWFGLMRAGAMLLSVGGTEFIRRMVDTSKQQSITRALFAINTAMVVSLILLGLVGNFWIALLMFWLFNVLRSVGGPIYTTWINDKFESSVRATMHSLSGQVDALGQMVGGPIIGGFANGMTGIVGLGAALRASFVLTGLVLSPVLLLFARTMRRTKDQPEVAAAPVAIP